MPLKNYSRHPARPLLALACALAVSLAYSGRDAAAAAGDLDPTFDADGKVTTDFFAGDDLARGVVVQADGKIVVAGRANGPQAAIALARYNPDGGLDATFGAGGRVTTQIGTGGSQAGDVALQPDGKIVVVGNANDDFAVARYNADGQLDATFGTGGVQVTDFFGLGDFATAVAVQSDSKIVVAGGAFSSSGSLYALARYNSDGQLDGGFGTGGKVTTLMPGAVNPFGGAQVYAESVAVQPDGKIVAAGGAGADFGVVRYNSDGQPDIGFNTGGRQIFPIHTGVQFDRFDRATSVIIQPDGKILVGGFAQTSNNGFGFGIARLLPDGNFDLTFGPTGNGRVRNSTLVALFELRQRVTLAQQPNGKIIAAGNGTQGIGVARFNLDGSPDLTFSDDGMLETDFVQGQLDEAEGVAVQPDGKIVVVGVAGRTQPNSDFALARYLGDAPTVQCLYGLSATRQAVPAGGGARQVNVYAPPGCAWTAVSNADWITVTSAAGGTGNGLATFTIQPKPDAGVRTGTLTIAGQTYTVGQNGRKVAVFYGGGQLLAEPARARVEATGLLAQVDAFWLHPDTTPTLAHLLQYDAVYYFHNRPSGPPFTDQTAIGNVLADYVERGRGVVIAGGNWDTFSGDSILGRLRTDAYIPFVPGGSFANGGTLVKLQPAHPIFTNISSVNTGTNGHFGVTLTPNAQRLADWSDGKPAVAVTQPLGGRVVGLNFYPPGGSGDDRERLIANSLDWAGSASVNQSFIAFGSASFAAAEAGRNAAVTVTRTGGTGEPATVEFSTVDDPAAVRCDAATGAAYSRCDYSSTVTTLTFAPGEVQKTANVPLIEDGHAEGPETVQLRLRRSFGAALGTQAEATLTISDNDAPGAANPLDSHAFFVRQHYLDFLGREPEEPGQTAWINVLANCPDVNNDPRCDRAFVSSGFIRSREFQLKGYYVLRFYRVAFGRLPTYVEMVADMQAVTGASPAEVFQKRAAFAETYVERAESLAAFPPISSDAEAYVNALMSRYNLQSIRTPDPANPEGETKVTLTRVELRNRLVAGTLTRGQVLRAVVESEEVDAAEFNPSFVAMQYFGYLRRAPEQPGYTNWLNYLNAHPNDFRTMIKGFIDSVEYRLRFGRP